MEFVGKVAVITGAASGIGRAVAVEMSRRNVRAMALVDMGEGVDDVAADINRNAGRKVAWSYRGDVTDEAFRASVFDDISREVDNVTSCVPAAGITRDDLAVRIDKNTGKARIYPAERFKQVIDVNLVAPVYWALEMIGRIAENRAALGLRRWHGFRRPPVWCVGRNRANGQSRKQCFGSRTWNSPKPRFSIPCLLRVRRNLMAMRSTNSSAGAARNHDWPSAGLLCSGIDSSWSRTTSLHPLSMCAWPPSADLCTRLPTREC